MIRHPPPAPMQKEGGASGPPDDIRDSDGPRRPDESNLSLPHERDEVPDDTACDDAPGGPREVIDQAARDIRRGLVDTEALGVPSNVPGPGRPPERSEGAVAPPEGLDRQKHRRPKPDGSPAD